MLEARASKGLDVAVSILGQICLNTVLCYR